MKLSYEELVKQVMVDGLEILRGTKIHTVDLDSEITEATIDRCISPIWMYTYFDSYGDMVDFMTDNWEKSAKFYEYWKDDTDEEINVFEEPEKLIYLMVQKDIRERLEDTEFIESHPDNDVILTDEVMTELKEELGLKNVRAAEWLVDSTVELER